MTVVFAIANSPVVVDWWLLLSLFYPCLSLGLTTVCGLKRSIMLAAVL
jgi:hypothetical protein